MYDGKRFNHLFYFQIYIHFLRSVFQSSLYIKILNFWRTFNDQLSLATRLAIWAITPQITLWNYFGDNLKIANKQISQKSHRDFQIFLCYSLLACFYATCLHWRVSLACLLRVHVQGKFMCILKCNWNCICFNTNVF